MEFGIIGAKLKHSFSKTIHEEVGGYNYEIKEIDSNDLDSILREHKFKGINVTIPYKKDVIKYLDYVDDSVKNIGACNLIINKNNKLFGYNTDYLGLIEMINYCDIDLNNKCIAILGTGGTSNTAKYVANILKAKEIIVVGRNKKDGVITYEELNQIKEKIEIIINTTPVGMYPNNYERIINIENFNNLEGYIDVIYNPLRTLTAIDSLNSKIKYATGLYMLVSQAFYGIELFKDIKIDKEEIKKYYLKLLKEKENIVLIGMPSSGKTTIGIELASSLNRDFYDVDELIVQKINMPIKDYFKLYGEAKFREIETEVIKEISKKQSSIVSTGGGSILKKDNIDYLKQNSKIFFLNRDLNNLIFTDDRPLSSNKELLEKLYKERIYLYNKYADVIIDGNKSIEEICKIIKED